MASIVVECDICGHVGQIHLDRLPFNSEEIAQQNIVFNCIVCNATEIKIVKKGTTVGV